MYRMSRLVPMDGIPDRDVQLAYGSVIIASIPLRSDEHKSSVQHRICAGELVVHGVFLTFLRFVFPWSTTTVNARTRHRSVWSLRECRAPSIVWIVFKSFASRDDLHCNQWVRKEAFNISLHRSQKLEPDHLTVLSFVLVIECDVLSIRSCKYRLFRGGIRVLEITLIYSSLDSLSSTFCVLRFTSTA